MGRVSDRRRILRINGDEQQFRADTLAVEEPLEIQLDGEPFSVTMRTPGDDVDLALGFLHSEKVIKHSTDITRAKHCTDSELNVLNVQLRVPSLNKRRQFTVSSACGACGTTSMDELIAQLDPVQRDSIGVDDEPVTLGFLRELPNQLRRHQKLFDKTGGVHAAGLFTKTGDVLCIREDIGRHNAVDKIVGWALRNSELPLTGTRLAVSGRIGAEIVQKAGAAGIPVIAAVSAPTTMAVDLATNWNMTMAGFVRGNRFNVYCGSQRITPSL